MIIGLCGAKNSGKSTVFGKHLVEKYKFVSIPHSAPIKRMMFALGLNERHTEGDLKEEPCDILCGKTPRWAMQSIGSEWGRKLMDPDFWVHLWSLEVGKHKHVVSDGVRFANEVDKIRELGGVLIRIRRPGIEGDTSHDTELYAGTLKVDHEIYNDEGCQEDSIRKLDEIMAEYKHLL